MLAKIKEGFFLGIGIAISFAVLSLTAQLISTAVVVLLMALMS